MHRIDGPAAAPGALFTEGDPNVGTPATVVTDDWLNAVQEEIANVIEGAGAALSKPSNEQLLLAVKALADAALPVGSVVPGYFVTDKPGFLYCNGRLVSRSAYPRLWSHVNGGGLVVSEAAWSTGGHTMFGAGDGSTTFRLPELRAEGLRFADDGRGVDAGRTLGSHQMDALQNIQGTLGAIHGGSQAGTGAFAADGAVLNHINSGVSGADPSWTFDASRVVRTASETRVRTVALGALVKY